MGAQKIQNQVPFSISLKSFLNDIFLEGEETGNKADPSEVSSRIRNIIANNGKKKFGGKDWLTSQQIASKFSRLSVLYRSGKFPTDTENDEDIGMFDEAIGRQILNENIRRHVEL